MPKKETAVLVGIMKAGEDDRTVKDHLDELDFLARTAGARAVKRYTQKMYKPHPKYFIGSGKLKEVREYVDEHKIDTVIFDDELTPSQLKNIERSFEEVKILDRTNLILDIFASRAQTAQAKAQVELAQHEYLLPRLTRMWTHLSRQKGGIGTKGPGEKEIETDRRIIRNKISLLKERLEKIDKQNITQRKNRGQKVRVALVGYTNAGKSTLMNALSTSEILAENKLFATLDTTVRKVVIRDIPFLLSDTVGFIRKLPHNLVESFKSTLDEVREADILLHVVDISHPNFQHHIQVVNQTLEELGASGKPTLLVFNKIDQIQENGQLDELNDEDDKLRFLEKSWISRENENAIFISATRNVNMSQFRKMLIDMVIEAYQTIYPFYPIKVYNQ